MKKSIILCVVLVLGLFTSLFFEVEIVEASPMVMVDQPWYRLTGVNQPVEFTANATGGTPPYTFQWYTTFLDPTLSPEQWNTVMVPDSNLTSFQFTASTPGRYGISIRLTESNGDSEYQSFQPIGIVVTVQSSPVSQSTPSVSPSPTTSMNPTPTPAVPEFQAWTILLSLIIMTVAGLVSLMVRRQLSETGHGENLAGSAVLPLLDRLLRWRSSL